MRPTLHRLALILGLLAPLSAAAQVISGGSGGGGNVYLVQAFPNASTSALSETNLGSARIPGGLVGTTAQIRITVAWTTTNNANNKLPVVRLSNTQGSVIAAGGILAPTITTTQTSQWQQVLRPAGVTGTMTGFNIGVSPYGAGSVAVFSITLDTTKDWYVNFNASVAVGTDSVTLNGYTVEVLHQ